ncbi:DUF6906 family protein [Clostridium lundense]|uniref:DUF6906 family protein n=1 Tax=Clostridium lundense TaxID=319475 RepID=UPI000AEE3711|nr:hypothetical protein [Clostridium lundense]
MKHGKKPTRNQKIAIKGKKLNPDNWLVVKDNSKELVIIHRDTGTVRSFEKA